MTISVLLVDDDAFHRQGLRTFLQLHQFQIEETADAGPIGLPCAS
jgi:YesN/AraC family two-component response regulator